MKPQISLRRGYQLLSHSWTSSYLAVSRLRYRPFHHIRHPELTSLKHNGHISRVSYWKTSFTYRNLPEMFVWCSPLITQGSVT